MTYINSRNRKSIIWWYENGIKTVPEIAKHLRFPEADVQALIDEHYREPEPDPRVVDPRKRFADILFSDHAEYERDILMDDLLDLIKEEMA